MPREIHGRPAPSLAVETDDTPCAFLVVSGMDVTPGSFPGCGQPGRGHGAACAEGVGSCL